ncbi:MAG: long-chain acyl-CoA synthetase [Saprospiraceae bacterium]|jgi:long-chain acyl-CoA synthetase
MEVTRLFEYIYYQQENYPLEKSMGYNHNGQWTYFSTAEIIAAANKVSYGLMNLGLQPGDKVALVSYKNCPEWVMMDIGLQQLGVVNVPVYPTISSGEYEYIFNDSEIKYCFVGEGDLYNKVKTAQANVPSLIDIYTFDKQEGRKYWKDIFTDGDAAALQARKDAIKPNDLATIIYTSGTTGNPKGVMLSHNNIVANAENVREILPISNGYRVLSFLPICHIFERTALYSYIYRGLEIVFTGTDNLGGETGDLQAIKPHFFTTVPRLLEKVYEKIYNKGLTLTGIKKTLFFWALRLTDDFEFDKKPSGISALKWKIADKLIFSKWREALGGNVKGILTGAAACPAKMIRVFSAAGVPVREGYGLTETSPGLTIGRYDEGGAIIGTVGMALPNVELMIDTSDGNYREGEGEILARGPNIMQGYYGQPDKTAEVMKDIDGERWFCTGDIGKFVPGVGGKQFLKITDRKKELLKTSGGKYVAPAPIENKFKEDFLIEQIMVVGEKQKFVSALIVPAVEALKDWCEENDVDWSGCEAAIKNVKVLAHYQQVINQFNPEFSHVEQIKKFKLLNTNWEAVKTDGSVAELTPTMKLKRRVILEKYENEINQMYV